MTDTAEYWNDINRPWVTKERRLYPPHDCKPRGGPKGTHNRWKCKVCGRRFASKKEESGE